MAKSIMIQIIKGLKKYREMVMYLIFGGATTLVNFISYTVFVDVLKLSMTISNAAAWGIAVSFAFVTNKLYVFCSKKRGFVPVLKETAAFICSRIVTGLIDIFLPTKLYALGLDSELFGITGVVAKAVACIIVIVLNYLFSKLLVFKKK